MCRASRSKLRSKPIFGLCLETARPLLVLHDQVQSQRNMLAHIEVPSCLIPLAHAVGASNGSDSDNLEIYFC